MNSCSYSIHGGDFANAGSGSGRLKEALKRVGVAPEILRRVMIAAYEAELNVVIHARQGAFRAVVTSDRVDVDVVDAGPGIPDIERAMQEGYSTASPAARALGFGAGMGLPNIRRNADRLTLSSTVGQGTQLHFTVFLKPQEAGHGAQGSVHAVADRCTGCLRCLGACPTGALRVRANRPQILDHLCVDCGECIRQCPAGALRIEAFDAAPPDHTLIGSTCATRQALRRAVAEYVRAKHPPPPVISPVCPAVIELIQTRFQSLLDHVAPFLTPIEAARQQVADQPAACTVRCPAECTALRELNISMPTAMVADRVPGGPGMTRVVKALDDAENGLLADRPILELYACEGCPVVEGAETGAAARRETPLRPRPGIRLDADMAEAIRKLARLDDLVRMLPGRDCGRCGAPTCRAAAEDVILGRVDKLDCPFSQPGGRP